MSDNQTINMLEAYNETSAPSMFLSSFFSAGPGSFYTSQAVEIDVVRKGEKVSVVIQDLSVGYRSNAKDIYTNKKFVPPIHQESAPLNAWDLIERMPGQNPFVQPQFQQNATLRAFESFRDLENMIRRSNELQCSQVLQSGIVNLKDETGAFAYSIDYKPKASHFPTVGTAWSTIATATPLLDLEALADQIRQDHLRAPDRLVFGATAWNNFIRNATVQALLDNRRMELGGIAPEQRDDGSKFMGFIEVGSYRMEMWTYPQYYEDVETETPTKYVEDDKVIMTTSGARLQSAFGAIPRIVAPDSRVLPFLPPRISNGDGRIDMFTNAWVTPDGGQLMVGVGSRPLFIPVAIDSFGCLDTEP